MNKGEGIPGGKTAGECATFIRNRLKFGKYKGESVETIFSKEPGYLLCARIHVNFV
jgi:hypothetical protein